MSDDWQNLTNGSFNDVPFHVAIPNRKSQFGVESEEMTIERRLQFIKRPMVDGAAVRDWGADPEVFTASLEFFGINHARTAELFLQSLNKGTPATLILPTIPKAVLAYFWKRSRTTRHQEGNTIRVTVTWVAATEIEAPGNGKASGLENITPSVIEAKASLDKDVPNALGLLQDNEFLKASRDFEHGLSQARSVVNKVLTLEEGALGRIISIDANIRGTLLLIKSATDQIQALFSPSAATVVASRSSSSTLGTNAVTGQTIVDFSSPDEAAPTPNPLAAPAVPLTIAIPTNNLATTAGVAAFGDTVAESLNANRDNLNADSAGRTEDVSRALTVVLNSLATFVQAVVGNAPSPFTLLVDMSLGEALFINGIDQSELRRIHKANSHVEDPFFIPRGTVLLL